MIGPGSDKNKDFVLLKLKKFELEFVLLFLQDIPAAEKDSPRHLKNKKPSCNSLGINLSRSFSHLEKQKLQSSTLLAHFVK